MSPVKSYVEPPTVGSDDSELAMSSRPVSIEAGVVSGSSAWEQAAQGSNNSSESLRIMGRSLVTGWMTHGLSSISRADNAPLAHLRVPTAPECAICVYQVPRFGWLWIAESGSAAPPSAPGWLAGGGAAERVAVARAEIEEVHAIQADTFVRGRTRHDGLHGARVLELQLAQALQVGA